MPLDTGQACRQRSASTAGTRAHFADSAVGKATTRTGCIADPLEKVLEQGTGQALARRTRQTRRVTQQATAADHRPIVPVRTRRHTTVVQQVK